MGEKRGFGLRRAALLAGLGLTGAPVAAFLLVVPELSWLLPRTLRDHPIGWALAVALLAYTLGRSFSFVSRGRVGERPERFAGTLDVWAGRLLDSGLARVVALTCLGLIATWAPHYLTWPWCRDADTFATLALSWDDGIVPYRDILAYNFPGQTYLFWLLGKTFGWGCTPALYAVDVVVIGLLWVALVVWSRRRLGGALPGLVGFAAFLHFYLGLQFELVAQRDWYAALCGVLAMFSAQTWPGRCGRIAAAAIAGLGLIFRPQAVLFLPAVACAITAESEPGSKRRRFQALAEAAVALSLALAIGFAPIVCSGASADFVRNLRIPAYGGPYSQATPASVARAFLGQFHDFWFDVVLGSTFLLAVLAPAGMRQVVRPWVLAWAGALGYAPLSPVPHAYLVHPARLVGSVVLALPVSWLASCRSKAPFPRLVAVLAIVIAAMPGIPRFCLPSRSWEAVGTLVRGVEPVQIPPGSRQAFALRGGWPQFEWTDYVHVLDYLRNHTDRRTLVANVLNRYPYESINGPVGRPSPFRVESGICWLSFVAIDMDATFAAALEGAKDSVVVWEPSQRYVDPRMPLPRVIAVIRRHYRPEARFHAVEVWRRIPDPPSFVPGRDQQTFAPSSAGGPLS